MTTPFRRICTHMPEGALAFEVADLAAQHQGPLLIVTSHDTRLHDSIAALESMLPGRPVYAFPAWDCLPYDRVSPSPHVTATRLHSLAALAHANTSSATHQKPPIVVTTVAGLTQKILPPEAIATRTLVLEAGAPQAARTRVMEVLQLLGYTRESVAGEPGTYVVRGGMVDVVLPGAPQGYRLDFFGETLETIRLFDPLTQISAGHVTELTLIPAREVWLDEESIAHFRHAYRAEFGMLQAGDPLYEAVSDGRYYAGMEHWQPLFLPKMGHVLDYIPEACVVLDHRVIEGLHTRWEQIQESYQARKEAENPTTSQDILQPPRYYPIAPEALYVAPQPMLEKLEPHALVACTAFATLEDHHTLFSSPKEAEHQPSTWHAGAVLHHDAAAKHQATFALLSEQCQALPSHVRVVIACGSKGSAERMQRLLEEEEALHAVHLKNLQEAENLLTRPTHIGLILLPLAQGIQHAHWWILAEQDLLGQKWQVRTRSRRKAGPALWNQLQAFSKGEKVVHADHGIGVFMGIERMEVQGQDHDFLLLHYADDDKLYVPVENMDLVTRYGGSDEMPPDRLGAAAWQKRTAAAKGRIKMAAEELLSVAAKRATRTAPICLPGVEYELFCSRFPYQETEDQQSAIEDVLEDLAKGTPMDRLVCGDVGFGKTEVALRAACVVARTLEEEEQAAGKERLQVALIAPTTLLCHQHYQHFLQRFAKTDTRIGVLSRMQTTAENTRTREALEAGQINIIIGTHALLARSVRFKQLGLVIVDEEQRFGVKQKERLKQWRANTHVLTLTATPIPRTLQLSLTGIRELSLITTPPVDRLAVRTQVMPWDPVILREAVLREYMRGGRIFVVCPRIKDLEELAPRLKSLVPEVTLAQAHGQMESAALDAVMQDFMEGKVQLLLCTTIIESGLDIPQANTLIVYRADRYGLAQLYQIRGRVGRSRVRAYAYLTLLPRVALTKQAEKRLQAMQQLDTLGAGFQLASHDMDIRGFGNLLGEEQSGHVREIGVELYQQMLRETVEALRVVEDGSADATDRFRPQLNLGVAITIAEDYIPDLEVRMGLYRRISALKTTEEVDAMTVEMVDRFGTLPEPVENLLEVVRLKARCIPLHIASLDTGPGGAVLGFHRNQPPNPESVLRLVRDHPAQWKLRQDQKLVYHAKWSTPCERIRGVVALLSQLEAA